MTDFAIPEGTQFRLGMMTATARWLPVMTAEFNIIYSDVGIAAESLHKDHEDARRDFKFMRPILYCNALKPVEQGQVEIGQQYITAVLAQLPDGKEYPIPLEMLQRLTQLARV